MLMRLLDDRLPVSDGDGLPPKPSVDPRRWNPRERAAQAAAYLLGRARIAVAAPLLARNADMSGKVRHWGHTPVWGWMPAAEALARLDVAAAIPAIVEVAATEVNPETRLNLAWYVCRSRSLPCYPALLRARLTETAARRRARLEEMLDAIDGFTASGSTASGPPLRRGPAP
jgi:hypothetical protein